MSILLHSSVVCRNAVWDVEYVEPQMLVADMDEIKSTSAHIDVPCNDNAALAR